LIEAKRLGGEIATKIIPILKDCLLEVGKEFSSIQQKHNEQRMSLVEMEKDVEKQRQAHWRERHQEDKK
jgi:hypothetical protein